MSREPRLLTDDEIRQISDSLDAVDLGPTARDAPGTVVLLGSARMLRDHIRLSAEAARSAAAPSFGESDTEAGRRLAELHERALRGEAWPSTTDEEVAFLFDQIARHESAARIATFARSEAAADAGRLREAIETLPRLDGGWISLPQVRALLAARLAPSVPPDKEP